MYTICIQYATNTVILYINTDITISLIPTGVTSTFSQFQPGAKALGASAKTSKTGLET